MNKVYLFKHRGGFSFFCCFPIYLKKNALTNRALLVKVVYKKNLCNKLIKKAIFAKIRQHSLLFSDDFLLGGLPYAFLFCLPLLSQNNFSALILRR